MEYTNSITVANFSKKYNVPEHIIWYAIEKLNEIGCKEFVKDESKAYDEFGLKILIHAFLND